MSTLPSIQMWFSTPPSARVRSLQTFEDQAVAELFRHGLSPEQALVRLRAYLVRFAYPDGGYAVGRGRVTTTDRLPDVALRELPAVRAYISVPTKGGPMHYMYLQEMREDAVRQLMTFGFSHLDAQRRLAHISITPHYADNVLPRSKF